MDDRALEFLGDLLTSPSPSGYEQPVQAVVRNFVGTFADEVRTDWHGNVIAAVNPGGSPRIMLAGHCDQIGLMVKHIDERGFLWVDSIGGWDIQMLIGQNLVVWGRNGAVPGVIARKAIHLLSPEDRKKVPEIKDLWIDIGVKDRDEARQIVAVGDPVTFELGFRRLRNNLAAAPGMDNKVGAWVVMSALQQVAGQHPQAAVYSVSTVQEEIGLRGAQTSAFSIDAQVGIAVDVTHATDCPTLDAKQYGEVNLGAGPMLYRGPNINPIVYQRLVELAAREEIPVQTGGLSRAASNDANVMQISRGGLATAIVAIPNRYMHSPVEVVSLTDLEHAAALIARFCLSLTADSDFTP
ncbi:MAG: M42 family peptidase [Planctomycetaceae bacterium]|nr:M42 family peptidase [Planctomycetaceae bacterium]